MRHRSSNNVDSVWYLGARDGPTLLQSYGWLSFRPDGTSHPTTLRAGAFLLLTSGAALLSPALSLADWSGVRMPQTRRIALLTVTRIFDPLNSDDDVLLLATSSSFLPSFLPPALNPSFGVGLMRECPAASVHTRALWCHEICLPSLWCRWMVRAARFFRAEINNLDAAAIPTPHVHQQRKFSFFLGLVRPVE